MLSDGFNQERKTELLFSFTIFSTEQYSSFLVCTNWCFEIKHMLGILKLAEPNKKKYHLIIFIDPVGQFYHKND